MSVPAGSLLPGSWTVSNMSCLLIYSEGITLINISILYYMPTGRKHLLEFHFPNFAIFRIYTVYYVSADWQYLKTSKEYASALVNPHQK